MNLEPLPNSARSIGVCLAVAGSLTALACGPRTPPIPPSVASAAIAGWLPGAEVAVVDSTSDDGVAHVNADVSDERLRFQFRHADPDWVLEGMVMEGRVLDHRASRDAWLDIVRTAQEVTLAEIVAGGRPRSRLEVVVTDLRVVSVEPGSMVLESTGDPASGAVIVRGRHFDQLPLAAGDSLALQLQDLARDGEHWVPERSELPGALLAELDPIDVTLLQLLKLRLAEQVVPVPYNVPDMAHEHSP